MFTDVILTIFTKSRHFLASLFISRWTVQGSDENFRTIFSKMIMIQYMHFVIYYYNICLFLIFNQILFSVSIVWIVCVYLTSRNSLSPRDPTNTESKSGVLRNAPVFRIPYPCNKLSLRIRFNI